MKDVKLFGEYLVEKNLIRDEDLLVALIHQVEKLPSMARLISEQRLLTTTQILEIFKMQTINRCSFIEAANRLSLWSEDLHKRVEQSLAANRAPLGEILIDLKCLDVSSLTKALDDYYGSNGKNQREDHGS